MSGTITTTRAISMTTMVMITITTTIIVANIISANSINTKR